MYKNLKNGIRTKRIPSDEFKKISKQFKANKYLKLLDFADAFNRYVEISLNVDGQTRIQAIALHFLLYGGGSILSTELGRLMFRPKHNMTKLIDYLEEEGLVTREYLKEDRRATLIKITPAGLERAKQNLKKGNIRSREILSNLDNHEKRLLLILMGKMRQNITKMINNKLIRGWESYS